MIMLKRGVFSGLSALAAWLFGGVALWLLTDGMFWVARTGPFAGSFVILAGGFAMGVTIFAAIAVVGVWFLDDA